MTEARLPIALNRLTGTHVKTRYVDLHGKLLELQPIMMQIIGEAHTTLYSDSNILCYKFMPFDILIRTLFKYMWG